MAKNKWIVDGHHYRCPSCKKTIAIVVNESDEDFEFCPFCGKRMSGQMTENELLPCTCSGEAYIQNAINLIGFWANGRTGKSTMERGGLKMATNKHMWRGEEKPPHLDNIKDWQLKCGDEIELILMYAVKTVYMRTYGFIPSEVNEDDLWPIVKDVMPAFIERMRADNIPVWNPEADSYEF